MARYTAARSASLKACSITIASPFDKTALEGQRYGARVCCLLLRSTAAVYTASQTLWSIDSERAPTHH